jgi:hypothetical protein
MVDEVAAGRALSQAERDERSEIDAEVVRPNWLLSWNSCRSCGANNSVTLCGLHVFVDEAAEPVSS